VTGEVKTDSAGRRLRWPQIEPGEILLHKLEEGKMPVTDGYGSLP